MRRVRTTSGAPAVQIVHKRGRAVLGIDHIGSAQDEGLPLEDRHRLMNRRSFQYGAWLADQARAHDLPVVEALPFESLLDRARAAPYCTEKSDIQVGLVSQLVKALSGAACRRAIRLAIDLVGPSFVVIVTTAETAPQTPASGRLAIAEIVYQGASQVLQ